MSKPEVVETEAEVMHPPVPANQDKMDALISAADKIDALGAALDKFRAFVLKRALPGDWVSFKQREGEEETLELIGAATDRIASALGINFLNFRDSKDSFTDEKGQGYTWRYICNVHWQGRVIEGVEGRAGTRDRFFGMAHGQLKALADINEADIRTAARRNCMKEGVKLMLGLRRIPKSAAASMGLDLSKVKSVEFSRTEKAPPKAGTSVTIADIQTKKLKYKKDGKDHKAGDEFFKYVIKDSTGFECDTLSERLAEEARMAKENGDKVLLVTNKTDFGYNLTAIKAAEGEAAQ